MDAVRRRLVFFDVNSLRTWTTRYGSVRSETQFRTSPTLVSDEGAVAIWLRRGELDAALVSTRPWDADGLRGRLAEIRALSRIGQPSRFLPRLRDILASVGVALVVVRAPTGCRASGATRPLASGKRMLLVSFRFRADDQFWFRRLEGADLHDEAFSGRLWLTDGGVYDNLGLEPVWKRYRTVLVSDGGAALPALPAPGSNWLPQANRVANVALQQGVAMRQRVLFGLARSGERTMAYWGINRGVETYGPANPLGFGAETSRRAAVVPTRLTCLPHRIQELVVKAGYAHADAALGASGLAVLNHPPSFDTLASLWPGADGKAAGLDASEPRRGQ